MIVVKILVGWCREPNPWASKTRHHATQPQRAMIVVKVGGSLFDHPALGPGLRDFLQTLAPREVLLVPGGGPVADAVRKLDRTHELGEEAAHWLALRSLGVTAELLRSLT